MIQSTFYVVGAGGMHYVVEVDLDEVGGGDAADACNSGTADIIRNLIESSAVG
jgi:hypothetical protein